MNKAFWSHFKHFGRLLAKSYLFLTPGKTDRRVPSEQGAPTICNRLTYQEVSHQTYVQTLLASLGVVIGQNSALSLGKAVKVGGATIKNWVGTEVSDKWHIAAIPDIKSSQPPCIACFPGSLSFQGHIFFKSPSQQKLACRADILIRNRSNGCPWIWCSNTSFGT